MDDAQLVGCLRRLSHVGDDLHGLVHRKLLLAVEAFTQRLTLDVRYHVEEELVRFTGIEERQNVRMLEGRRDLDFAKEPLGTWTASASRSSRRSPRTAPDQESQRRFEEVVEADP